MKRGSILAGLLLLGLLPAAQAQQTNAAPRPHILCPKPVYDFGEQENTRQVEHTYTIRNKGDAELRITRTRT